MCGWDALLCARIIFVGKDRSRCQRTCSNCAIEGGIRRLHYGSAEHEWQPGQWARDRVVKVPHQQVRASWILHFLCTALGNCTANQQNHNKKINTEKPSEILKSPPIHRATRCTFTCKGIYLMSMCTPVLGRYNAASMRIAH